MLSGYRELESEKERLSDILRAARRVADEAEVFSLSSPRSVGIQFEANELKQVQTRESSSTALRIFREGRVGFATASGGGGLGDLVDMAVESSRFGSPANFEFPPLQDYSRVSIFDPKVEEIGMEEMVGLGKELIGKVTGHTPGVLCDAEVARGTSYVSVINSRGGEGRYDKTFFSLSLEGILVQDTDMLFVAIAQVRVAPTLSRLMTWRGE